MIVRCWPKRAVTLSRLPPRVVASPGCTAVVAVLILGCVAGATEADVCVAPNLAKKPGARFCAQRQRLPHLSAVRAERCKTLHVIRHAEGLHNEAETAPETLAKYAAGHDVLLEENSGLKFWDAALTLKGLAQSETLRDSARMAEVRPRVQLVLLAGGYLPAGWIK